MSWWMRVAADIHRNPKVRKAGPDAREVFIALLAINAQHGFDGLVPASYVDPAYLGDEIQRRALRTAKALERCFGARLLSRRDDGSVEIVGWDEEWSGRAATSTERSERHREKARRRGVVSRAFADVADSSRTLPTISGTFEEVAGDSTAQVVDETGGVATQTLHATTPDQTRPDQKNPQTPVGGSSERVNEDVDAEQAERRRQAFQLEREAIGNVVAKLNERSKVQFDAKGQATSELIRSLLRKGFTEWDLRLVIWHRAEEWAGDPERAAWLRPSTLFRRSKFEEYLPLAVAEYQRRKGHLPEGLSGRGVPVRGKARASPASREDKGPRAVRADGSWLEDQGIAAGGAGRPR